MRSSRFIKQSLVTASVITISANVLSRVFGYFREAAIANYFGTTEILDTFILAFTVPEILSTIIYFALPTAVIPSLKSESQNRPTIDSGLFLSGFIAFFILFAGLSGLIFYFRESIICWLAPGLPIDQHMLGVKIIGIVSFVVLFRGMEAYFRSWLFEKKHFIIPATSNILLNITILGSLFMFYEGANIASLAYGWLFGSIALFLYNGIFATRMIGLHMVQFTTQRWVKAVFISVLSVAVVQSIPLVYSLIDRYLAARYLAAGQIAALRYAMLLIQIPIGIIVVAFNIASFPWISDYSSRGQAEKLKRLYSESIRQLIFVMGIISIGILIFSSEIVTVAFKRGTFDNISAELTAGPLMYYAIGTLFYSIYIFQMRFYYAKPALLRLGLISVFLLILKLGLSLLLIGPMEHNGLALATTITWSCGFIIMTFDLSRYLNMTIKHLVTASVLKSLLLVAIVAGFWVASIAVWPGAVNGPMEAMFLRLMVLFCSGIGLYLGLAFLMKLPEPKRVLTAIKTRYNAYTADRL